MNESSTRTRRPAASSCPTSTEPRYPAPPSTKTRKSRDSRLKFLPFIVLRAPDSATLLRPPDHVANCIHRFIRQRRINRQAHDPARNRLRHRKRPPIPHLAINLLQMHRRRKISPRFDIVSTQFTNQPAPRLPKCLFIHDHRKILATRSPALRHSLKAIPGHIPQIPLVAFPNLVSPCDPPIHASHSAQSQRRIHLSHPRVDSNNLRIVIAGISIIPRSPQLLCQSRIMGS